MVLIYAHLGHVMEPLAFAPAVAVFAFAFLRDRRARSASSPDPVPHTERAPASHDTHPRLTEVED